LIIALLSIYGKVVITSATIIMAIKVPPRSVRKACAQASCRFLAPSRHRPSSR
jgi:hypothetical protein